MRLSTLPPLLVAVALIFGAASQYPGTPAMAFAAVGFVLLGAWLTLEIGSEVVARWRRFRGNDDDPK